MVTLPPNEQPVEEAINSTVVAVAAIEADTIVRTEEIRAEVAIAAIEAQAEGEVSWQERTEKLEQDLEALSSRLNLYLGTVLTPQALEGQEPHQEPEQEQEAEIVETALTPPFISPETGSTEMEVSLSESVEEAVAELVAPLPRKRRLI